MIATFIEQHIRTIKDFPKEGVYFKDITPLLLEPSLCDEITDTIAQQLAPLQPTKIAAIESRGFLFGMLLANKLRLPFVPIRKEGKLPAETISACYELEYGTNVIELHKDAITPNDRVVIHDDVLATGGTAKAAYSLIESLGGTVVAFSFLLNLDFLHGKALLEKDCSAPIFCLKDYD
ncbi:MAG: adenine phosphoribosyltransferase [Chitinophagales bacterium]